MAEGSGSATALLGMDGFVVLTETEEDGELYLLVETAGGLVGCPGCGVRAVGHARPVVQVRDLPMAGRPVRLAWRKRRWQCGDPDCEVKTFTETSELLEGSLTCRAAREICRQVGEEGHSVASVARSFGVGWHSAWAAAVRHGSPWSRIPADSVASPPSGSTSTRCSPQDPPTTPSTPPSLSTSTAICSRTW